MKLDFNSQGYLHQTIELTYEEFRHHFATNPQRIQQIENSLPFFRTLYSCGCRVVYVDGSFVSIKKNPEDIDLCFDFNPLDAELLEKNFPQFFDVNAMGRIRRDLQCHILYFTDTDTRYFDLFELDRNFNKKGLVKLGLKEILTYHDQK